MKRVWTVAAALTALAALSACATAARSAREVASLSTAPDSSTDDTDGATATTVSADPNEAALQFAKCMRENGVDMPDPVVQDDGNGGGGVMIQVGGPGEGEVPDKETMDAANKECQHFLEDAAGSFNPPSPEEQERMKEQALEFSKCMREHGIDMPDPQFGDDGTFSVGIGGPDGTGPATGPATGGPPIDFNSKEFQEASEACGQDGGFGFTTGTVAG